MQNDNPWKVLSSKVVYANPWMRVREDAVIRPDGSDGIYGVIESKDSVVIIAVNDKNKVFLIRSFSYPASAWYYGLPGGCGDDEMPEVASKRELAEETGITAKKWTFLSKIRLTSGLMNEQTSFLLAQDLEFGDRIDADDKEIISGGKFVSFDEIDAMVARDEINDAQSITGIYLASHWLASQQPASS